MLFLCSIGVMQSLFRWSASILFILAFCSWWLHFGCSILLSSACICNKKKGSASVFFLISAKFIKSQPRNQGVTSIFTSLIAFYFGHQDQPFLKTLISVIVPLIFPRNFAFIFILQTPQPSQNIPPSFPFLVDCAQQLNPFRRVFPLPWVSS